MMKKLLWILILCSLCRSCLFGGERYECDLDQVKTIQIVRLADYVEGEYRYEYDILSEIEDHSSFVEKLNKVECNEYWGPPLPMDTGDVVIRIIYLNGDYDLIKHDSQWITRSNRNGEGFFSFDEAQFVDLISQYLQ